MCEKMDFKKRKNRITFFSQAAAFIFLILFYNPLI